MFCKRHFFESWIFNLKYTYTLTNCVISISLVWEIKFLEVFKFEFPFNAHIICSSFKILSSIFQLRLGKKLNVYEIYINIPLYL